MSKGSSFQNILHTPSTLFTLIRNVNRQKKFIQQNLSEEINLARQTNDGSLDQDDFKKITSYYGLAVPAILGEALCVLRGNTMTEKERTALTYQGAMTGLFDDFFDKEKISDEQVRLLMEKPEEIEGKNARQKLFLQFYIKALKHAADADLTIQYLRKVYAAQIESKKQAIQGSLSKEEIKRITIEKGGVSVLFYRSVLKNPLSKEEETALYQIGGLMQFGNDIFDVYKDCKSKIDTLITTAKDIAAVRSDFIEMKRGSFASVYDTNYSRRNSRKFLRLVNMSLCSRCFVFMEQLEQRQKRSNNIFTPYQYDRKDLICDMEKASNKWKTIKQFAIGN